MSNGDKRSVATDALDSLGTILKHDGNYGRDAIHLAVIPTLAGEWLVAGQSITVEDGVARPDINGICIVDPFLESEVTRGEKFWAVIRPRTITSLRHVWEHPDFPNEESESSVELRNTIESLKEMLARFGLKETDDRDKTIVELNAEIERLRGHVSEKIANPTSSSKNESEKWLRSWCERDGNISYEQLLATVGHGSWPVPDENDDNYGPNSSWSASIDGEYLTVYGYDANGDIPNEVWDHVEVITGQKISFRPRYFSCSC